MSDFEKSKIDCKCLQSCEEDFYTIKYSSAAWPSNRYEGWLFSALQKSDKIREKLTCTTEEKNKDPECDIKRTKSNLLRLSFTFDELNKQLTEEEEKYTVDGLIRKGIENLKIF